MCSQHTLLCNIGVVQHNQNYTRDRSQSSSPTSLYLRRKNQQKAKVVSHWDYKPGVYMKGSVEEILREGLIIGEIESNTNATVSPTMDKKEIDNCPTENIARQQSAISEYFDAGPGSLLDLDDVDLPNQTPGHFLLPYLYSILFFLDTLQSSTNNGFYLSEIEH